MQEQIAKNVTSPINYTVRVIVRIFYQLSVKPSSVANGLSFSLIMMLILLPVEQKHEKHPLIGPSFVIDIDFTRIPCNARYCVILS